MNPWMRLAQKAGPGFGRVELLLSRLGHPEEGLSVIQVAGTHGKSSVVAFLEAVFCAAGVRVGVCASPDFPDPAEAVRLQGRPVPAFVLSSLLSAALEPFEEFVFGPGKPTTQEALLAVALAHFARSGVDVVVLEASTGNRWDPTNFLRPWLSLLTRVEAGENTKALAWEAAQLARPGIPLLTTAMEDAALESLARGSRAAGAALVLVDPEDVELLELRWEKAVWRSRSDPFGLGPFETPFMAAYQAPNLSLVFSCLAELFGGFPVSREALRQGLAQVELPGRFELLHAEPWVVADAAQDLPSAQAVLRSLERLPLGVGQRFLLLAHPEERLAWDMASLLCPAFSGVEVLAPWELPLHAPRALRRLSSRDFLLILGPHAALREVKGVVRGAS